MEFSPLMTQEFISQVQEKLDDIWKNIGMDHENHKDYSEDHTEDHGEENREMSAKQKKQKKKRERERKRKQKQQEKETVQSEDVQAAEEQEAEPLPPSASSPASPASPFIPLLPDLWTDSELEEIHRENEERQRTEEARKGVLDICDFPHLREMLDLTQFQNMQRDSEQLSQLVAAASTTATQGEQVDLLPEAFTEEELINGQEMSDYEYFVKLYTRRAVSILIFALITGPP